MSLLLPSSGQIFFDNEDITRVPTHKLDGQGDLLLSLKVGRLLKV